MDFYYITLWIFTNKWYNVYSSATADGETIGVFWIQRAMFCFCPCCVKCSILAVKSKVDIHLRHIHHLNFPFAISDNPSHKNFNQLGWVGVAPGSQNWIQHSCKLIKLKATKLSIGAKWTSTRITYQSVLTPILSISWKSDNLQNHSCYFQKCISNYRFVITT